MIEAFKTAFKEPGRIRKFLELLSPKEYRKYVSGLDNTKRSEIFSPEEISYIKRLEDSDIGKALKNKKADPSSKKTREYEDKLKYGFHITDSALVNYLGGILGMSIDNYRHEKVVPRNAQDEVIKWKKQKELYIKMKEYVLVVKNQTVITILTPPYSHKVQKRLISK
ncbi:MAG TPA: hypothetical protein EYQ06_04260 [Flavobacteriales bacterium]|jgi:hypothetical protein|nr:hypothetical protein [Flavobacteriales bacterium]